MKRITQIRSEIVSHKKVNIDVSFLEFIIKKVNKSKVSLRLNSGNLTFVRTTSRGRCVTYIHLGSCRLLKDVQ